ncbi:MAG TPA: T9SS type A sorting domain-containing protein [Candidatus Nanoarchaeia archaeon]|nr:T9SS type A sorting domain-containing protein [Candidatus Nanoarchaeia archaeon]
MGLEDRVRNLFAAGAKAMVIPFLIHLGIGGFAGAPPAQAQSVQARPSRISRDLEAPDSNDFFPLRVGNSYEYHGLEVTHTSTRLGNSGHSTTIDSLPAVIAYRILSLSRNDSSQLYTVLVETQGNAVSIQHVDIAGAPTKDDTSITAVSRTDTMHYLDRGNEVFRIQGKDTLFMGRHTYSNDDFFTWDEHGLQGGSVTRDIMQAMDDIFDAVTHTSYSGFTASPQGKTTQARHLLNGIGLFVDSTFVDISPGPQTGYSTELRYLELFRFSQPHPDSLVTGIGLYEAARDFALHQNYPNPFNPRTTITYQLPRESLVALKIFNLIGQEVMTLVNGRQMPGTHQAGFDAGNLPSGVYFYRLQTPHFAETRKMLLMR